MNLASDGLATDSQWSWHRHLQAVLRGRPDRAELWAVGIDVRATLLLHGVAMPREKSATAPSPRESGSRGPSQGSDWRYSPGRPRGVLDLEEGKGRRSTSRRVSQNRSAGSDCSHKR